MHQEPKTEKPPTDIRRLSIQRLSASELAVPRIERFYSLKAPWRLVTRLPEPM
jgi:hypothetical protein